MDEFRPELKYENFEKIISAMLSQQRITDIHLTTGFPPAIRLKGKITPIVMNCEDENGNIKKIAFKPFTPVEIHEFIKNLVLTAVKSEERANEIYEKMEKEEIDIPYSIPQVSRFRLHISKQRGSFSCSLRVIPNNIPEIKGYPKELKTLISYQNGFVIISGKSGNGKSTTLATLIQEINKTENKKVVTLEDPIEYLHKHQCSLINQREIGTDTKNFTTGLISALREDPDIIVIGEMRDAESFEIALNAAESGCLVLTTMHSATAKEAIERLISIFPTDKQNQIRTQLASTLKGVVCQQLIPCINEDYPLPLVAAFEILLNSPALTSLINKNDLKAIPNLIKTNKKQGMITMEDSLNELKSKQLISDEQWFNRAAAINSSMIPTR